LLERRKRKLVDTLIYVILNEVIMFSNYSYHINYIENNQYLNLSALKAIMYIIVVNHEIMSPKIMDSSLSIPKTITCNDFVITNFTIIEVFQKVGTCLDRTMGVNRIT
jgi:hypothetical protein